MTESELKAFERLLHKYMDDMIEEDSRNKKLIKSGQYNSTTPGVKAQYDHAQSSPNFGVNSNEQFMYNNIAKYVLSVCGRYHVVTKVFIASLRADEPLGWCMSRVPRSGAELH